MRRTHLLLAWIFFLPTAAACQTADTSEAVVRIGMIGLDTSHSPAFARLFNTSDDLGDFRVVAALPLRQPHHRIQLRAHPPLHTEEVEALGVEVVGSIEELIGRVDVVLLETNDGRLHLEQALPVLEAGKPLFIDKPMAASLADVLAIFEGGRALRRPRLLLLLAPVPGGRAGRPGRRHRPRRRRRRLQPGPAGRDAPGPVLVRRPRRRNPLHRDGNGLRARGPRKRGQYGRRRRDVGGRADRDVPGLARGRARLRRHRLRHGAATAALERTQGYEGLVEAVADFFRTGKAPVPAEETVEIFAFMAAAEESKERGGASVALADVLARARERAAERWTRP